MSSPSPSNFYVKENSKKNNLNNTPPKISCSTYIPSIDKPSTPYKIIPYFKKLLISTHSKTNSSSKSITSSTTYSTILLPATHKHPSQEALPE